MCKTTTTNTTAASKIARIVKACRDEADPGKKVRIRMYDPKGFINSNDDLKNALNGVQAFYNGLHQTPQLPAELATDLGRYTFEVTYQNSAPSAAEIDQSGRMDFPMYVFHTPDISADFSTVADVEAIMEKHGIASQVVVRLLDPDPTVTTTKRLGDAYAMVEGDWKNKGVLGFGFPGNYYGPGTCHKLGLIRVDAILANIIGWSTGPEKFKSVVAHELGHMFALHHEEGTLMNEHYVAGQTQLLITQIDVIRDTLKKLSP